MRVIFVTFVTLLMASAALAQTPTPVTPPACEQAQAVQSQQFISVPVYGYVAPRVWISPVITYSAPVVCTPTVAIPVFATPVYATPVYATPVVVRPRLFRPGVVVGPVVVRPVVVGPIPTILPRRAWTAFW